MLDFSIKVAHPFPSVTVQIAMEELTCWDSIALDGLNDDDNDRNERDQGQEDINSRLPRNGFPEKIKARFRKRKSI